MAQRFLFNFLQVPVHFHSFVALEEATRQMQGKWEVPGRLGNGYFFFSAASVAGGGV